MSTWIWSGYTALYAGSVLFALVLIPLLALQHRRYGRLSPARLLGSAALTVYVVAVATYTWLPLPPRSQQWCEQNAIHGIELTPLHLVGDIRQAVAAEGLVGALTSFTFLQVAFNVLLFVPWGVIVRGFLHRSFATAAVSGLVASVLVEATQATGLWFVYPCAYRMADIDDVITNTTGAVIGALLAPALVWWMPRARGLRADRLAPRRVTVWRRWTGMAVDAFAVWALSTALTLGYRTARIALGLEPIGPRDDLWLAPVLVVSFLVVFWLPAWRGGSAGSGSAGHNAVWLTPVWRDGGPADGTRWRRLLRASVVAGPWVAAGLLPDGPRQLAVVLAALWVLAAVALVPFTQGGRSLSGLLTGSRMVDIRAWPQDGGDDAAGDRGAAQPDERSVASR